MATQVSIPDALQRLRATFAAGKTRPLEWRLQQLAELERMLREHAADFSEALQADLHKCRFETALSELGFVESEAKYARKHLRRWARAEARADADDGAARQQLHPARAQGHRADHRAVELSAVDGVRAAGRRDRGRQLRRAEAVGDHQPHVRRAGPAHPALSRQRRVRGGRGRRAGDDRTARAARSTTSSTPATSASRAS